MSDKNEKVHTFGRPVRWEDIAGMLHPMRCLRCYGVHDAATVQPTGRYSDCTVWRCPNCKAEIDDRPRPMGSAVRVSDEEGWE